MHEWYKKNHKKILYINRICIFTTSCFITLTHEITLNEKLNMIDLKGGIDVKTTCMGIFVFRTVGVLIHISCLVCYIVALFYSVMLLSRFSYVLMTAWLVLHELLHWRYRKFLRGLSNFLGKPFC